MPKVAIVNPNSQYIRMFQERGWEIVDKIGDADLVQFTGGEDVTPAYYGALPHPTTYCNPTRDAFEKAIFERCISGGVPMVGICRGGQFLNVMSGGAMWQDVDNHAIHGTHMLFDLDTGEVVDVSSTHHQMMKPSSEGNIIATASESYRRENVYSIDGGFDDDVEVVYYPNTQCLCFQPHPEYPSFESCQDYYFDLIERVLNIK